MKETLQGSCFLFIGKDVRESDEGGRPDSGPAAISWNLHAITGQSIAFHRIMKY